MPATAGMPATARMKLTFLKIPTQSTIRQSFFFHFRSENTNTGEHSTILPRSVLELKNTINHSMIQLSFSFVLKTHQNN
jgi:hypothetical protein